MICFADRVDAEAFAATASTWRKSGPGSSTHQVGAAGAERASVLGERPLVMEEAASHVDRGVKILVVRPKGVEIRPGMTQEAMVDALMAYYHGALFRRASRGSA